MPGLLAQQMVALANAGYSRYCAGHARLWRDRRAASVERFNVVRICTSMRELLTRPAMTKGRFADRPRLGARQLLASFPAPTLSWCRVPGKHESVPLLSDTE